MRPPAATAFGRRLATAARTGHTMRLVSTLLASARLPTAFAPTALVLATLTLATLGTSTPSGAVDDDLLAHELYRRGRVAEAAELFTDPAWKGVALYRSGQWWRAADAFVRADDPLSAHNLGNCYVKLGYYALALDAYRRALAADPSLEDARHNAALMVRLLELEANEEDGASSRTASNEEIERIGSEEEPESGSGAGEEDADEESGERAPGESAEGSEGRGAATDAEPGEGGDAREGEELDTPSGEGGGSLGGEIGDTESGSRASGSAESAPVADASEAAGLRSALESEQATEQWLNRIEHDPARFLERRIALELRRRRAAGQSAPDGGSVW